MNLVNRTIYGQDNLVIMAGIDSQSVDLIYLDPPFNKKRVFTSPIGTNAEGASFRDIFTRKDAREELVYGLDEREYPKLKSLLGAVRDIDGSRSYNFCYLVYMAVRLLEMRRILKPTGSLYLHCDPTMSHYLKVLLDVIFEPGNFRNEIVWQRAAGSAKGNQHKPRKFGQDADYILYYAASERAVHNPQFLPLPDEELSDKFPHTDENGRRYHTKLPIFCTPSMIEAPSLCYEYKGVRNPHRSGWRISKQRLTQLDQAGDIIWREGRTPLRKSYADEYQGFGLGSLWTDIPPARGKEREGYPTQKPLALLERIIAASSNPGDLVLDPFCGCATTCVAAEMLGRRWVGIDVSVMAYDLVRKRLTKEVARPGELFTQEVHYSVSPPRLSGQDSLAPEQQVYIISNVAFPGWYKVGITKDIARRLGSYNTAGPHRDYRVEYRLLTHYARAIETATLEHFERPGDNHEWVSGDLDDLKHFMDSWQPD